MNEKWQITKKELKTRAQDVAGGYFNDHMMQAAVATARALGYEVVEEPELPERIDLCRLGELHGLAMPRGWLRPLPYTTDVEALTAELVLRYNAKTTVLAQLSLIEQEVDQFAVHWPRPDLGAMIARIRAAYGEEKP